MFTPAFAVPLGLKPWNQEQSCRIKVELLGRAGARNRLTTLLSIPRRGWLVCELNGLRELKIVGLEAIRFQGSTAV